MGYAFATGNCVSCKRVFSFNANKVPSVRVNGRKEPVCETCVEQANPIRKQNGLEEIVVLPGAYESCNEVEL